MSNKPNEQDPLRTAAGRNAADDALKDSSHFFSTLAQISPVGIFRTDAQGNCVYVNERWCKISGMKYNDALGAGWVQAIHPDDRKKVAQAWYISAQAHQNFIMDYRFQRPNGVTRWVQGEAAAELDAAGKVVGYVGTITDITQSKQLEEAKQEALDRLQKVASQVPGIVYQFRLRPDGSACVPYASEAAREIYRLNPEEIRKDASKVFAHVHPDDLENLMASIQASARDLTPWQHEYRLKFDDGTHWLFGNALPQREADGSTLWHGFLTDITERKKSEERLQQSEEKLRAYLDNISDTIWLIDANMNMAYVSPSVTRLLGVLPKELIGRPSALVIHPDDMGIITNAMRYVMEHPGEPHTIQYRVSHKDGRWIHVESTGISMLGNPAVNGVLVTMRDITERKRIEADLQENEASMRAILDNSPYLVWLKDPEGRYITANKAHVDYVRLKDHREIIGKTDFDFWPKELAEKYRADDAEVIATCRQKHIEEPASDGGKIHWVETFKTPIIDKHGNVLGTTGFARDITERKNIEDELKQTKERYDFATEVGKVGTWDWNPATGNLIWSDETFRLMGLTPGAVTPSYELFLGLIHPDDRKPLNSAVQAALHDKKPYIFDCRIVLGSGQELGCQVVGKVEFDAKDKPVRMLGTIQDITKRKQAEQALAESESRFREIFNTVSDAIFIHDAETGRIIDVNHRMCDMYGLTHEEALACGIDDLSAGVPPYSSAEAIEKIRLTRTAGPQTFDWLARARDGHLFWVEVSLRFALIGSQQRILAVVRDISERRQAEEELRIAAIAFETQEGMVVTDAHSVILRVNHAFTEITGYTAEEAIGQTPRLLKSGRHDAAFYAAMWKGLQHTGAWQGEIWNRRKNGGLYPEYLTITAVKRDNGEITHYVATMIDITERKRVEEQIHDLAFHDSLTQLPNRRLLNDRLEQTMAASKRSGYYGALMFLDLDDFKLLNDTYGHDVGDLLLVEVAHRISSCVREVDTVARFGGDEFMVMLGELDVGKAESATQAGIVAEKIRAILANPYVLKFKREGKVETTIEHHCTSSIGVVLFTGRESSAEDEGSAEDIVKWADLAMYQAKNAGGNLIRFHE